MTEKEIRELFKPAEVTPIFDNTQYSITRVQKRFKDIYDLRVEKIDYGYKGYRYRRYKEYDVFNSAGECVMHRVTLKALAEHLVRCGEYY